jgi:hypothetical protein
LKARIERFDICSPVGAASLIDWNGRLGQAVVYGRSPMQRKCITRCKQAQESENEEFCSHDLVRMRKLADQLLFWLGKLCKTISLKGSIAKIYTLIGKAEV